MNVFPPIREWMGNLISEKRVYTKYVVVWLVKDVCNFVWFRTIPLPSYIDVGDQFLIPKSLQGWHSGASPLEQSDWSL